MPIRTKKPILRKKPQQAPPSVVFDIASEITSAVLTPKTIKNLSIFTGLTEQVLTPLLERTAPSARAGLIKLIIDSQE